MENRNISKYIKLAAMLLWMGIIFYFSNQDASESSKLSNGLLAFLFKDLANDPFFRVFIRKCAHAFEFFVLAILVYVNLKHNRYQKGLAITLLYAISDEIHQYFVPGRAMMIQDVLIDLFGAILGMFIVYCYERIKLSKAKRKGS